MIDPYIELPSIGIYISNSMMGIIFMQPIGGASSLVSNQTALFPCRCRATCGQVQEGVGGLAGAVSWALTPCLPPVWALTPIPTATSPLWASWACPRPPATRTTLTITPNTTLASTASTPSTASLGPSGATPLSRGPRQSISHPACWPCGWRLRTLGVFYPGLHDHHSVRVRSLLCTDWANVHTHIQTQSCILATPWIVMATCVCVAACW